MSTQTPSNSFWKSLSPIQWTGFALLMAVITWAIGFYFAFYGGRSSIASWLMEYWNYDVEASHGWLVPPLCIYMLIHACQARPIKNIQGSLHGLWLLALGALLFLVAVRTQQSRIGAGCIPFMLAGAVWCYWGGKAALRCAFPIFFFWMCIPLPMFQQATVGMQLMTTKMAHAVIEMSGIETIVEGTNITFAKGDWDTYSIAGGCSGMRSLMALIMISCAWGYLADKLAFWKRVVLALSAFPLSIVANAFRVASIFICAEYINPVFASKTWHDWSGLLFFFPASLLGLTILHGLLAGEIPFLKRRRTVITRRTQDNAQEKPQI